MVQVVDMRGQGTDADQVTDLVTHPMKEQNLSSLHASGMLLHQRDSIILVCSDLEHFRSKILIAYLHFVKLIQ